MFSYLYFGCLVISVIVLIYMGQKNYNNIDIYYWSIMIITPFIFLGYWFESVADTREGAMFGVSLQYLDGTVMTILMLFSMLRSLRIPISRWLKIISYTAAFAHMCLIWACRNNDLYYATYELKKTWLGTVTIDTAGPLKFLHYIYLVLVLAAIIIMIVYGFAAKGTYSHRTLFSYAAFTAVSIMGYAVEIIFATDFSVLPFVYVLAIIFTAFNYDHAHSHDIDCLISERQKNHSQCGYVAFDLHNRLLGANELAALYLPRLKKITIDEKIPKSDTELHDLFYSMIAEYRRGENPSRKFQAGNITCKCEVSNFMVRKDGAIMGYLFEIRDITKDQKYLDLVEKYNDELNREVSKKTEHIKDIQMRVVLGLANMVENRDHSTGGHIKRTSHAISILIQEIRDRQIAQIDDLMAQDIVRAAPMHDLGKISIDSSILCKPGRLTEEEYKIMKTHSVKSGEIVKTILEGVEEQHFVNIAYNLARYHHERWDGKGYPEGLSGTAIPLEARIMAVADVYDALISRRCYKLPLSFDEAYTIMIENMGTQFDPMMKDVFMSCRQRLESYYEQEAVDIAARSGA